MRYLIVLILMPVLQILSAYLFQFFFHTGNDFWQIYCLIFLQQICAVFLPVLMLYRQKKYLPLQELKGFHARHCLYFALLGVLLQFIGTACNLPLGFLLQNFGHELPPPLPNPQNTIQFLFQMLTVCVCPAIFEEVLFRRFLFDSVKKYSHRTAIVVSAVFFAMAHFDFTNLAAAFFIGIILGILRSTGASLFLCILTHFFVNLTANLLNIALRFERFATMFNHYYALLIFLCTVILIAFLPKRKKKRLKYDSLRAKLYYKKLFSNPLLYFYTVIFVVLGVMNL